MPLDIQFKRTTATVTVQLAGSLDTATAPELLRQLTPVLDSQVTDLAFDLANLTFISSAGLRVFSISRKRLKERGGQTSFVNMQPQIKEVFEIVKALPGVSIFSSMAEMDAYLAAQQRKHTGGGTPDPNGPTFTIDA